MLKKKQNTSFICSEKTLPEITIKSIILSIILIVILASSNAYLGLKVGATVSGSIPAVVIALGIFRLFRRHSVLEINIVQTAAAVGEGLTGGIIFILPALLIMHFWTKFHYWETVGIAVLGGVLGVLFSVPLKKALLEDKTLKFPEGTAIGQVMKASTDADTKLKPLVMGGIIGSLIGLFQTGFRILADSYQYWSVKGNMIVGFGLGFSPAIIAAGYICGATVGFSIFVGILMGWIVGVPLLSAHYGVLATHNTYATANQLWLDYIRYIGVGTMLIGGLWTLVTLLKPVFKGIKSSIQSLKELQQGLAPNMLRTERDIPINFVFWGILLLLAIMFVFILYLVKDSNLHISPYLDLAVICFDVVYILIAGFIFSVIAGYFAGLVGVTNSPASGLFISALLILSSLLLIILGPEVHFHLHPNKALFIASVAVMICAFIGVAMVTTGEAIQVFKAGTIVKASPYKQQIVLIGSVVVTALVLPFILNLLFNAYGIGGVFPHPGMDHSQMMSAPQAGLIAAIAQGVFSKHIPWNMVSIGALVAVVGIIIDEWLKRKFDLRLPVLAVGLGIYLPIEVSVPAVIGGFLAYIINRNAKKRYGSICIGKDDDSSKLKQSMLNVLLSACGLVAGASLIGVILAIPFAIKQSTDVLRLVPKSFTPISEWLSIVATLALCVWMYRQSIVKRS